MVMGGCDVMGTSAFAIGKMVTIENIDIIQMHPSSAAGIAMHTLHLVTVPSHPSHMEMCNHLEKCISNQIQLDGASSRNCY